MSPQAEHTSSFGMQANTMTMTNDYDAKLLCVPAVTAAQGVVLTTRAVQARSGEVCVFKGCQSFPLRALASFTAFS